MFLIASNSAAARDQLAEMRARTWPLDTNFIPVFQESDLRGRQVESGDTVVLCGDWSVRPPHEVQFLATMFNSRRTAADAPELHYRAGEAPIVVYPDPEPVAEPITIQTMGGATYTLNPAATGTTTTTSAQVAWDQVLDPPQQRLVQDAQDAAKRERAISTDMRAQVKKAQAEVERVQAEIRELRSWLSGVQPVEDTEIPELLYCGVCYRQLHAHVEGCPAAPE